MYICNVKIGNLFPVLFNINERYLKEHLCEKFFSRLHSIKLFVVQLKEVLLDGGRRIQIAFRTRQDVDRKALNGDTKLDSPPPLHL